MYHFSSWLLMTAITIGCAVAEGGGEKCQWSYKCDIVLENDPFVCGKWRNTPDIVCTDSSDSVVDLTTESSTVCETTYRCCKLSVKKRYFQKGGSRRRLRLVQSNLTWRRGAKCLKWCAVHLEHCETEDLPSPYETVVDNNVQGTEVLHGTGETEADVDEGEPTEETPPDDNKTEFNQEELGNEDLEIDFETGPTIGPRFIIKVPCNGNSKPDYAGNCRSIF